MDHVSIEDVEATAPEAIKRPVPDRLKDKSQRYCVMTVVAPNGTNQKCDELMIRIHGCRKSMADANKWAKALRDSNDFYDVFTVKTNEWAPLPPNLKEVGEVSFTDQRVQTIHDNFVSHLKGEKKELEERLKLAHEEKEARRLKEAAAKEERVQITTEEQVDEGEGAEESKGEEA
jgi:Family of unknown function (DUF5832)